MNALPPRFSELLLEELPAGSAPDIYADPNLDAIHDAARKVIFTDDVLAPIHPAYRRIFVLGFVLAQAEHRVRVASVAEWRQLVAMACAVAAPVINRAYVGVSTSFRPFLPTSVERSFSGVWAAA